MKKILILLLALSLTGCSSVTKTVTAKGEVVDCAEVDYVAAKPADTLLNCLTGSQKISVESLRGPLILNVWGSWCGPCKQEMPYFVELYQNPVFKNGEIQMLGVNVEEKSRQAAVTYIQKSGMRWPNLGDTNGASKSIFGPGVPVTWFIDKEGKNVGTKIGAYTNKQQLFDQVEKAFGVKL